MELREDQAYLAMYAYLEAYFRRTRSDDVAVLLGSMSLLPDGTPADPAFVDDWKHAKAAVNQGSIDTQHNLE